MKTLLNRIILLNVELEGALRVAADRPSAEALESAKKKFAEISALFAMLNPTDFIATKEEEKTELKEEEAVGAESAPMPEPEFTDNQGEAEFKEIEKTDNEEGLNVEEPKQERGDIRKMLTLNDKFLFKRELFGNNDEEFNATLDLLGAMHSFEEAEEYAYEDLRWDKNDPKVNDFMTIVENYFA